MLSAIGATLAAWLAKEGAALLLGALSKLALDAWNSYRADQALKDLGRVTAERDEAQAASAAKARELDAAINAPQSVDDAIRRLEEGSA